MSAAATAALGQDPMPKEKPAAKRRARGKPSLEPQLAAMFETAGQVWSFRDETCGGALVMAAGDMAKALNTVAMQDPQIYKFLTGVTSGGGWGSVFIAVSPVMRSLVEHHMLPAIQRRRDRGPAVFDDAPADLEPEAPPINPGEYAGTDDLT